MADLTLRLATNVEGDLFVDESCIDCATCRWMAPEIYDAAEGRSRVHSQPTSEGERLRALQALIACPTASIGTKTKEGMAAAVASFPIPVTDDVFHCGYHAESSFGAASWLIRRPEGNVLVDSPRFAAPLVRRLEELGGVATLFLTHRDDVADHARFAEHFGCERILHEADQSSGTRDVERVISGDDPVHLADDLMILPVPGHTRGSCVLIYDERVLFSGDHLAWSNDRGHLVAFRRACWYDWDRLKDSMARLARYRFEWVLPGHGWPCRFPPADMARELQRCQDWMETL